MSNKLLFKNMYKHFLVTLLICPIALFGQDNLELPTIIPPTPTVSNLMSFEEVPVSLYTGKPDISLPLFSKKLQGNLNLDIVLSYNTDGVKVDNRSGWTGTGWSLFAGGVISRTVRDLPDEILQHNKKGVLHNDDFWDYENLSFADQSEFNWNSVGSSVSKLDRDVDLYQFSFLNYSGRFVLIKDSNGDIVPKLIEKKDNIKIEFDINQSTLEISSFTLTDPYGIKYIFDVVEITVSQPFYGSVPQGHSGNGNASATGSTYTANSAWHLSSIKTSNDIELASFSYQTILEEYIASVNRTTNEILGNPSPVNIANPSNQNALLPKLTVFYLVTSSQTKKISDIQFIDGTGVEFQTVSNLIHPETGGGVLDKILIKKRDNNIFKSFELGYDITTSNNRLWLTQVSEKANNQVHEYILNYHNKASLPSFDTTSDPWGYHSGIGLPVSTCGGSAFNNNIIKTGLLNSIIYPTGGVKEFDFEHHSFSYFRNDTITFVDYIKNPNNISHQDLTEDYVYTNPSGQHMPITSFTLDFEQDIYVTTTAAPSQYLDNHRIYIVSNNFSTTVKLNETCYLIKNLPPGDYNISLFFTSDIDAVNTYTITGDVKVDYSKSNPTIKQEMIGGGVRIKEVRFKDSPAASSPSRKLVYTYNDENNSLLSSGVVDALNSKVGGVERIYERGVTRRLMVTPDPEDVCGNAYTLNYLVKEKGVNVELSSGSYVGYKHIKVAETGNGYTTYRYTSPYIYPTPVGSLQLPTENPMPNIDFKRGLLLEKNIYNSANQILRQEVYLDEYGVPNYDFVEEPLFKNRNAFKPDYCETIHLFDTYAYYKNGMVEECCNPCTTVLPSSCGPIPQYNIDFNSGWARLKGKTVKEYFPSGPSPLIPLETNFLYEYNDSNFQVKEETMSFDEGNGQRVLTTKYYYAADNNLPVSYNIAVKNTMVDLNKINNVLVTERFNNSNRTEMFVNRYEIVSTNQVLPDHIQFSKGQNSLEDRIQFDLYDLYGNPLQVSMAYGPKISYIYGYNHQYPVAKIENKAYNSIPSGLISAIQTASSPTGSQSQLITALNNLRADSSMDTALITTYTYKPLVGVTTITAPNGDMVEYFYDGFGRLEAIKDRDGNLMQEFEYNYGNN